MFKRLIASLVCFTFIFSNLQYVHAQAGPATGGEFSINQLPVPGTMVGESAPFSPLALKGLIVNPQKPLEFQFIVDTGSDVSLRGAQATKQSQQEQLKQQANQLVKYFLAGLTIPEGDLWVNLSPYEKDRMVPAALGQTDLGRDLLAQDYILKQLTASLIYPEKDLGKEFWSRVYAKAQQQFGTTNVPVNTFNKVWILPDQAQVYENGNAAYVTKSTLKVMLDEDYLALSKHVYGKTRGQDPDINKLGSDIVRAIVIPELEKEVNTGKNFAPLRQIYQALILAKWYKETIQNGLLDAVYTNKNKIAGVNLNDPSVKEQIYDRYLKAYKKGAFNYIKEDTTPDGQVVPRKYFSGGTLLKIDHLDKTPSNRAMLAKGWAAGALLAVTLGLSSVGNLALAQNNIPPQTSSAQTQPNLPLMFNALASSRSDKNPFADAARRKFISIVQGAKNISGGLRLALNSDDEDVQRLALDITTGIGPDMKDLIPPVKRLLEKGPLYDETSRALISIGEAAVPALSDVLLNAQNKESRLSAAEALEAIRSEAAIPALIVFALNGPRYSKSTDLDTYLVQNICIRAILKIDPERKNLLVRTYYNPGHPDMEQLINYWEGSDETGKKEVTSSLSLPDNKEIAVTYLAKKITEEGEQSELVKEIYRPMLKVIDPGVLDWLGEHKGLAGLTALGAAALVASLTFFLKKRYQKKDFIDPFNLNTGNVKQWDKIQHEITDDVIANRVFPRIEKSNLPKEQKNRLEDIIRKLRDISSSDFEKSKKDNPLHHSFIVLDIVLQIAFGEGLPYQDIKKLATVAILHDLGSGALKESVLKRLLTEFNSKFFNPAAKFSEEEDIPEIYKLVGMHDNPGIAKAYETKEFLKLALIFHEADRLWMLSYEGLTKDLMDSLIKGEKPLPVKEQLTNNIAVFSDERKSYDATGEDYGVFKGDTFLRTDTGYAIYQEYVQEWKDRIRSHGDAAMGSDLNEALSKASFEGDKEKVLLLLGQGANVNAKGDYGETALLAAASNGGNKGAKDIVELLLANKADVNAKTDYGETPLMLASADGHKDIVEPLLAKGADVNAENKDGKTALSFARENQHMDIVSILEAVGAKDQAMSQTQKNQDAFKPIFEEAYNYSGSFFSPKELKQSDSLNLSLVKDKVYKIRITWKEGFSKSFLSPLLEGVETHSRKYKSATIEHLFWTGEIRSGEFLKNSGKWKVTLESGATIFINLGQIREIELSGKVSDRAMLQTPDKASLVKNGGIDLNQINVKRNGKTVNVQFDPAQLNELMQEGFEGFTPVIINITHISSPFQLLGINPAKQEVLAKV